MIHELGRTKRLSEEVDIGHIQSVIFADFRTDVAGDKQHSEVGLLFSQGNRESTAVAVWKRNI